MKRLACLLLLTAVVAGVRAQGEAGAPAPEPAVQAAEAPPADDDRKVEEIVVTAQKTKQSLEDVPLSVTALSGDFITETGSQDLADVAHYVPNVRVDADDLGSPQLFIRGFGTNSFNPSFEGSVGYVQDDVYFGRPGYFTESMFDVERIEVLRGPQGTLFGKNTIAGVFNVTSKGPGDEWAGDLRATRGEHGQQRYEGGAGGPVTDWLGVRVAGLYREEDGELYNTDIDRDEEKMHQAAGRAKVDFTPIEGLKSEFLIAGSSTHANFWPQQLMRLDADTLGYLRQFDPKVEDDPKDFRTSMDTYGFIDKGSTTLSLDTSYSMENVAGLKSLTPTLVIADSRFHIDQLNELDDSPADIARLDNHEDHRQDSIELRFAGSAGSLFGLGTGVDFVTGLFYYDSTYDLLARVLGGRNLDSYLLTRDFAQLATGDIDFPGTINPELPPIGLRDFFQFDYSQNVKSYAAFGQMTWKITDHWVVTPGIRYNREKKDVDSAGHSECDTLLICIMPLILSSQDYDHPGLKRKESDVSPKIVLQYFFEGGNNVYASYTRGFKSGGFNAISLTGEGLEYKPEKARTAELGVKGKMLDDSMRFSLTVYQTKFDNLQVLAFNGLFFDVSNAAAATSKGLEADFEWLTPWEPLAIMGSFGLLDAKYDDYDTAPAPVQEGLGAEQDLSHRRIAFAPKATATLTPMLTFALDPVLLRLAADVLYQGNQYTDTDLDRATYVKGYTELAARVIVSDISEHWSLTLGGTNLTDKRVLNQVTDATFFPGSYFAQAAAGRQLFATVGMKF